MFNTIKQKARKLVSAIQRNKVAKKVIAVGAAVCVMAMSAVTCFAADGEADMTPEQAATEIFGTMSSQMNVGTIVSIIGIALGACLGLVLAWWAIRKVSGMVITAFKNGRART